MSGNQSWRSESGCLVPPPSPWTGVAFSMQHIHDAMTSTYHAKRQRANSVPVGSRPVVAKNPENIPVYSDLRLRSTLNATNTSGASSTSNESHATTIVQPPEQTSATAIPHWQHELARSRVGRHSRASSIISTRTRLTVQSEDARSVELEAGGQSFRISRDGAVVTNTTAPPPYPGPPLDQLAEVSDEEDLSRTNSIDTVRDEATVAQTPRNLSLQSLPIRTHVPPTTSDDEGTPDPARKTSPFEIPRRTFRQVLNSLYGAPTPPVPPKPLPRSKGSSKYLRRTQSDSSSLASLNPWDPPSSQSDTDGYDTYESTDDETQQTTPISKRRHRLRKHKNKDGSRPQHDPSLPPPLPLPDNSTTPTDPDQTTAELSEHYTHLLRTLDRTHRTALHARDEQLARLRELLNEKDIIYRQQLRDRDHVIDSLTAQLAQRDRMVNEVKTRMYEVEEDVERRIEKARNEVEDMWERRWKEFEGVLRGGLSGRKETGQGEEGKDEDEHEKGEKTGSENGVSEDNVKVVWEDEEE